MSDKKTGTANNKRARPSNQIHAKKRDDKAKIRAKELDTKAKLLNAKEFRETNVESDFNSDLVADKSWHSAHAQVTPEETLPQGELDESTTESPESIPASKGEEADVRNINFLVDANDSQVETTVNKSIATHRGGHHLVVDVKGSVLGGNDPLKHTAGNTFKSRLVKPSDHTKSDLVINAHHSPASNHSVNQPPQANTMAQHTLIINHLPPSQSVKEDTPVDTIDGRLTASGDGSQSVSWSVASTHGKYGDLQLNRRTGEWHYHLDNRLVDTDHLGEGEVHTEHFTVTATDNFGHVIQTQVSVNVEGTNDAPTLTHATVDQTVDQGGTLQFALPADTFNDIDHGDALTLSTGTLPGWLHFDASTGTFTGTPTNSDVGQTRITVTATDTAGVQVSTTFDLTVNNVNDAPVLTPMATVQVDEDGATASGQVHATDIDVGDSLTFSAGQVDGFTFHSDGSWSFDPSHSAYQHLAVGETLPLSIPITVTDSQGATDVQQLNIVVTGTNDAPTVVNAAVDQTVDQGGTLQFALPADTFNDIDHGDTLTLSTGTLPGWLHFDASTGTFTGTPANSDVGQTRITVTATDTAGAQVSTTFDVTVNNVNDAPVLTPMATVQVDEDGAIVTGQTHATDIDAGDTLTYSAGQVDGFTFHSDGSWSFDPSHSAYQHLAVGETLPLSIPITVTDSHGATDVQQLNIVVTGTNDAPTVVNAAVDQTVDQGDTLQFALPADTFNDIDHGDTLTLSTGTLPGWLHFDASTGTFTGTPTNSDVGQTRITVTATDTAGAQVSTTFDLTVNNVNDAPVLTPMATVHVDEDGATASGQVHATDIDVGDSLTYSAGQVDGFTFNTDGSWSFDPSHSAYQHLAVGETLPLSIPITVTDSQGATDVQQLNIVVTGTNDAPTVVNAAVDQTVDQGGTLQFALPADTFNDIDHGDTLTLSTGTLPGWLYFDASTGTFTGTPTNSDVGQTRITVTAIDSAGAQVSTTFDLTVNNVNDAPVLTPMATVHVDEDGATASGQVHATDIDAGDTLTFSAGQVDGFTFHSDGSWSFDPSHSAYQHLAVGETLPLSIPITVTDSHGATDVQQLNIVVTGTNDAPTVVNAAVDQKVDQGGTLQFALPADTFNDIDHGDALTLSTGTLPGWLHFDASTGTFTGTPTNSDVGQTRITVTATDAAGAQVSTTFDLTVNNVNDAPVLTPMATVHVDEDGATASGQVHATDIDAGDTLTYSAGQVDGFTFHSDGSWSFDPSHSAYQHLAVGETLPLSIPITVTDSHGATDVQQLDIVVTGTNDAPTVVNAAVDQTVDQGDTLQFALPADTFNDIDHGDTLTLSTGTLPGWLHFDASTGTFTGTPTNSDVGQTRITVTAIDSAGAQVSTTFDLTVNNVNDAPVLTPMATVKVDEDGATVTGQTHATDIDAGDTLTYSAGQVDGFTFNTDGSWSFDPSHSAYQHLAVGETLPLSIPITVTDSQGATDVQQLNIVVTGTNDAPILSIQPVDNTSGHLTQTDVDSRDTHQFSVVQSSGSFGDLIVNSQTGEYNYVPRSSIVGMSYDSTTNTYRGADVFEVHVTDNHGAESTKYITFDVQSALTHSSTAGYQIHSHVVAPPQLSVVSPSLHTSSLPSTNNVSLDLDMTSDTGVSDHDHLTRDDTPTVHGTSEIPFSVIEIHDGNSLVAKVISDAAGHYQVDLPHMVDAAHSLTAIAVSPSSISGTSAPLDLTVDTQSGLHVNPIAGDNIIDSVEHGHLLTIDGTANGIEDGQIVTVSIGGNNHQALISNGLWSVDIDATEVQSLKGGLHDLLVSSEDRAGNVVSTNTPFFVSDSSTPVPSMSFQTPPKPTGGGTIGSHISGTIAVPPLLQQLIPQQTSFGGWGIDDGHGHTVTSLHGHYGTLTIDPATGHVEYIYNSAPVQGAKTSGGIHVAGQTTTEEHHDMFKIVYHDVHASDVDVKVNLDVTYIHGHSGHNHTSTHLVDMTLTPASLSPAPSVQHDEAVREDVVDEFTLDLLDDSNGTGDHSDMNALVDGLNDQPVHQMKPIDHYLDMVGVPDSRVSSSDEQFLGHDLPIVEDTIDHSLDDASSNLDGESTSDPLIDSTSDHHGDKHLLEENADHQVDTSQSDDLLHQGLDNMHNHM